MPVFFMESQRLPVIPEIARTLTESYIKRRWASIVRNEEIKNIEQTRRLRASCIVGFSADSTLPQDMASVVASYIKKPINDLAIYQISALDKHLKRMKILKNGRGGEGLHMPLSLTPLYKHKLWLLENQQPRLRFSQPDFRKEIRMRAHLSLYRRLHLQGNVEEQLSEFLLILQRVF